MKISVPNLPASLLSKDPLPPITHAVAVARVAEFLNEGNVLVVTGAGVSVDSGIRAYRGKSGHYMNPNYKPIFYHELVDPTPRGHSFRQTTILVSLVHGLPTGPRRPTEPNALRPRRSSMGRNVDGLHQKAIPSQARTAVRDQILELHGTLHTVHCRRRHKIDRMAFQDQLSALNPAWKELMDEMVQTGSQLRTNPDGDVDIHGVDFSNFVLPVCETCLREGTHDDILKPDVIFFGESIAPEVKQRSYEDVETAGRVLFIGTTLATYSAFRLLKHATELGKPVMLVNLGPTRADDVPGVEKIEVASGKVLRGAVRALTSGSLRGKDLEIVNGLLESGVVKPPPEDGDRAPRAAG
ncbi:hypothetical protein FRC06_009522 [Ceratobasidium sp. 370]|nr:hypothetical protein FRC06_009522 [Ceratobasidium sp. 370]